MNAPSPLRSLVGANFLLAALVDLAASAGTLRQVLGGELVNPDSYMRLVRLHDQLAAGHALDEVARDGSGLGNVLPWSHLLDSLLVALSLPLRLFADADTALLWLGMAAGPLSVGALAAALTWAIAPVAERRFLWAIAIACPLAPPVLGYGMVGVLHHHVLLAVVVAMAAGWVLRLARGEAGAAGGIALGAWAGAGIWLSPETAPFSLLAFGGAAMALLRGPATPALRAGVAAAGTAFVLVTAAALAVDPPHAGLLAPQIDRVSVAWLAFAGACCVAGWALAGLGRTGGATVAVAALAVWVAAFPEVLRGAEAVVTPEQARAMLGSINEMQPVRGFANVVLCLGGGLPATGLIAWIAWRRRDLLVGYAALAGAFSVVVAAQHLRFSTYTAGLAAAMLPLALALVTEVLARRPGPALAFARAGLVVAAAALPWMGPALPSPARAASEVVGMECHTRAGAALVAPYPGRIVLSEPTDTPELLYRTGVLTVGSLFHGGIDAFMRLRAAWRSPPGDGPDPAVVATGASLLLVCPRTVRLPRVADLSSETLLDRLWAGEPPPWLRRVAAEPSGYVLYERLR